MCKRLKARAIRTEPVYYSQGKPYLRHIATSRVAEPHEVTDAVKRYLNNRLESGENETQEESAFLSELASNLHRVLMWADTPSRERHVNPWLEDWRADYAYASTNLRELASTDSAEAARLVSKILELANALDEVTSFRMYIGCGSELEEVATQAGGLARQLKADAFDQCPLSEISSTKAIRQLGEICRQAVDLSNRAQQTIEGGRVEEVQSSAGSLGQQLMQLSYYNLEKLGEERLAELRRLGLGMRLVEAIRMRMDGGASMQRVATSVQENADKLSKFVQDCSSDDL